MQLKIYLSSTFTDLETHREKVYRELRKLGHDVVAMEDYVATDKRPLEQCLQDVRSADVYVGIFAWRYGYVPTADNPDKISITALELREAERFGKPRLIFVLKNTAPWPPLMMDATTGDNERGVRINMLRDALQQDRLVGMFDTAEELTLKVFAALYRWQMDSSRAAIPEVPYPATPAGGQATARKGYILWTPGSRLRVRFLNGPSRLHRRLLRMGQIWSAYANISFEASNDDAAEVRVAFDEDTGTWCYLGTQCLEIDSEQPTMNFSWLRVDSAIDELESAVCHLFGRALGLLLEHNNPDAAMSWRKETVYKTLGGPPYKWPRHLVDEKVFSTWPRSHFPFAKPFDPYSIMAYPIPSEWTQDGRSIGRNMTISPGDREFVSRLYPYADSVATNKPIKSKPAGGASRGRLGRGKQPHP